MGTRYARAEYMQSSIPDQIPTLTTIKTWENMLISIILTLTSDTEITLPPHLGRANHAATLARLTKIDPALTRQLHDDDGPKPLTCSSILNLRADRSGLFIRAGQPVQVRITGLTPAISAALMAGLLEQRPAQWELDRQRFAVVDAVCDAATNSWTGQSTYEHLAASQLLAGDQLARTVELEFASPTAFHSKGATMPVPLPELVFGSLVDRWNAFSPITLSPEIRRYGEEMMAISRYRLESQALEHKAQSLRIGGVGRVRYAALSGDRYWLGVMQMLADFALYSGVGVQTTMGMGQARKVS